MGEHGPPRGNMRGGWRNRAAKGRGGKRCMGSLGHIVLVVVVFHVLVDGGIVQAVQRGVAVIPQVSVLLLKLYFCTPESIFTKVVGVS